jgi:hypothetical protein
MTVWSREECNSVEQEKYVTVRSRRIMLQCGAEEECGDVE